MEQLPLACIFSILDVTSLSHVACVCKLWNEVLNVYPHTSDAIWIQMYYRYLGGQKPKDGSWQNSCKSYFRILKKRREERIEFAILGGHIKILEENINVPGIYGKSILNLPRFVELAAESSKEVVVNLYSKLNFFVDYPWDAATGAVKAGNIPLLDNLFLLTPRLQDNIGKLPCKGLLLDAIRGGKVAAVKYLIEKGERMDTRLDPNFSPSYPNVFHEAAKYARLDMLKFICKEFPDLILDIQKWRESKLTQKCICSVHHYIKPKDFIAEDHIKVYRWLIKHKLDHYGFCHRAYPLHWAAEIGNTEFIDFLVFEMKEDINRLHACGKLPIHFACNIKTIKHLVDRGANLNAVDWNSRTLFTHQQNSMKNTKYLLDCGLNPSLDPDAEKILFAFHANFKKPDKSDILFEITKQFISRGISINCTACQNRNLLHYADRVPSKVTKWLLENGINTNHPGNYVSAVGPFLSAAKNGQITILELLAMYGEDIQRTDHRGQNALFYTLNHKDQEVVVNTVRKLLELGVNRQSTIILQDAYQRANYEVIELLFEFDENITLTEFPLYSGSIPETVTRVWKKVRTRNLILAKLRNIVLL